MKSVICLSLVLTVCVFADGAADRLAIEKLIVPLNQPQEQRSAKTVTALFAPHADPTEVARLSDMVRQMDDLRRPWLELNTPRLSAGPIRFVTPEVALVDATFAPYGSAMPGIPVLFVMTKFGADWRIAAFRADRFAIPKIKPK